MNIPTDLRTDTLLHLADLEEKRKARRRQRQAARTGNWVEDPEPWRPTRSLNEYLKDFYDQIDQKAFNECWEWRGVTNGFKYGRFIFYGKNFGSHRIAYMFQKGMLPNGLFVCHKCDNPICCNPDHLFIGTNSENIADCVSKGRQVRGEKAPRAVLSNSDVLEIRKEYKKGKTSYKNLGKKYGVRNAAIYKIINRRTWKHLN